MRILFYPNRIGINLSSAPLANKVGMPLGVATTVTGILEEIGGVSLNPGNQVHVEAPAKMFACERDRSCFTAWQMPDKGSATHAERLNENFDAVCLSFANMIQPHADQSAARIAQHERSWRKLTEYIRHLDIPIYVFGVGLQHELPPEASAIPPTLFDLLKIFNEKCALFGVRGETTERWLHAVGLKKAVALGCPSLYVYPRNVLSIQAPELTKDSRIGSAGRLHGGPVGRERSRPLKPLGEAFNADYVFQNDFFALMRRSPDRDVFDDATGLVDGDFVRELTQRLVGFASPFRNHYFFRDTHRWRMFAHMHDAYVGDRFHGGIVFLQVGRPALILQADARVRELTGFVGIPTLALSELGSTSVFEGVQRALSPEAIGHLHETYRMRLGNFVSACEGAGLSFADRAGIDAALGRTPAIAAQ